MYQPTNNSDLESLSSALTTNLPPQVLAALSDLITIVDDGGQVVTAFGSRTNANSGQVDPQQLGEAFIQGLHAVLTKRRDSFEHVDADRSPEKCARYRVLPLGVAPDAPVIGAVIVRHPLQDAILANRRVSDTLHHVADVVHDLRTELNAVIGFADMMRQESWGKLGDDHYRTYAEHIHLSGNHLLQQINQLLDLSRAEYLGPNLQEQDVDLAALLNQCCQSVDILAQRGGLAVSVHPQAAPTVRADFRLIRRVVLNLLSNAIKFTPTGGRIAATTGLDHLGRPFLSVRDNGIGIRADHLDKVMQPFAQIDSLQSRRHVDNGSGLGLPLSKRLMELQGGSLVLESAPDQGTTVTAWLPRQRMVAVAQPSG
ncbi:MAG: HAMP domain-containing histidine kinase [Magnetospirillum gryphiswaldense]|nr:HAMP domain-containing histidine kinase [Magnetospirillum gryphiswaldense]